MGQYYKAVNLDKEQFLSSYDYDNGAKLMEHSYIGNCFVGAVERLLIPGGDWHKTKIVWAGDYADEGKFVSVLHEDTNLYSVACDHFLNIKPPYVYEKDEITQKYIINHTKKEYVDRTKVPESDSWKVNPLPLLTCDGNGRGGGDYHPYGDEETYVGYWAGDVISIEDEIPEGFKEIIPDFKEE